MLQMERFNALSLKVMDKRMAMRKLLFLLMVIISCLLSACEEEEETGNPGGMDIPSDTIKPPLSVDHCVQCLMLAEQLMDRVAIADVKSNTIIWEWNPSKSNVRAEHVGWFKAMTEAKLVYNGKYLLVSASGGGVALVRIADKKTLFYAYAGGNTHSVELLPDGNIVSASSTGNFLTVFKTDTLNFPDNVYKKNLSAAFAHNVVWDKKNECLWTAAKDKMLKFKYNFDCDKPDLMLAETIDLPGNDAHDLFPVYGEEALWLSNATHVYKFDVASKAVTLVNDIYQSANIKSVSSGPAGFQTLYIIPKTEWWTDEVKDGKKNSVFYQKGLKIYKARWFLPNAFSYPSNHLLSLCN